MMSDQDDAGVERGECPRCSQDDMKLIGPVGEWTEDERICGWCIRKHGENVAREGERLQGQRTAAEENAIRRERGRWRQQ